jgi:hypothetical protein
MQTHIPVVNPNNPGKSTVFDFRRYKKSKQRSKKSGQIIDLVDLLSDVLLTYGEKSVREGNWLRLNNGFWLLPQSVPSKVIDGSIRTETTIEINHPTFIPNGFFDYQYVSKTDGIIESLLTGFNEWVQTCATVLCDSLLAKPINSQHSLMEFPNSADVVMHGSGFSGGETRLRRIIFGPLMYFASLGEITSENVVSLSLNIERHDEYCPCCFLLKRYSNIFMPFLNSDDYVVIQLYASRNLSGDITTVCYVNGKVFEDGRKALMEDAKTWPQRGTESRKNTIIVQNVPAI